MKRISACVLCALCVICCPAMAGCSVSYSVISESFSFSKNITVNYNLNLSMEPGEYNLTFTVYTQDEKGNRIDERVRRDTVAVGHDRTAELCYSFTSKDRENVRKTSFENMQISRVDRYENIIITAAVTGSVAAIILAGLIILYVSDKKKKLKK